MYLWGVIFAVLSGLSNQAGHIVQKLAVNEVASGTGSERGGFFARLLRRPLWVLGLVLEIGVGTVFFLLAQVYTGPALIPGLMASGLIVLALGSAWILREPLGFTDLLGIASVIAAAVLLGLSRLSIDLGSFDIMDAKFLWRGALFSLVVLVLFMALLLAGKDRRRGHRDSAGANSATLTRGGADSATLTRGGANSATLARGGANSATLARGRLRGLNHALCSGLLFVLSNFWVGPFTGTVLRLFQGRFNLSLAVMFTFTSAVLVLTNMFGIAEMQKAFRVGRAAAAVPVQVLPTQVAPALVYLVVFRLQPPSGRALLLFMLGALMTVASSFLIGGGREGLGRPARPSMSRSRPMAAPRRQEKPRRIR